MEDAAKENDERRIAVSKHAYGLLTNEVLAIRQKGSHFKVNEAKLASCLIEIFFCKYLDKERSQIEKAFFDERRYLKALIDKSSSAEDLSASVEEFLQASKMKRSKRRTKFESPA